MTNNHIHNLVDHLFRHESGKLNAVLTGIFGTQYLEMVEDVVQDSLLEAIKVWSYKGIPQSPSAWLHTVAKNKALNMLRHEKYSQEYTSDAAHLLQSEWTAAPALDHLFSGQEVLDDQLRMMFTCCHPAISQDSQVALTLKTLCGFSIPEIARAFLSAEDTVNKRLVRARKTIREAQTPFAIPQGKELEGRLDSVLEVIYLLFNEGYYASAGEQIIRYELCEEAIRLARLLVQHENLKNHSKIYALMALMLLNASRFQARLDAQNNIIRMEDQNRNLWDRSMMNEGFLYLGKSTDGNSLSRYHILAAISANHCAAPDFEATNWENILSLYDSLLHLDNSPVVMLNRCVALAKVKGTETVILSLEKMKSGTSFLSYPLFFSTLAEFYLEEKQFVKASENFKRAIEISEVDAEKAELQKRIDECRKFFL